MKNIALLFSLILLAAFSANAQESRKYSNEFLNIGVGARAAGMSNSVVASTQDVYSGYWNPAGLAGIENNLQVGLMHSEYFAGIANYDYGSFATKLDNNKGTIGASFIRFGVDGIVNTFDLIQNGVINYDRITYFSAVDYAFLFSYAKNTKIKNLTWGSNVKVVHRKVGPFAKAWGFGLDFGMQYKTENGWHFGANARDVTSTFNAWSFTFTDDQKEVLEQTDNDIPENNIEVTLPKLLLGVGKRFNLSQKFTLAAEANFDMTFDGRRNTVIKGDPVSVDPHLGLEFGYKDLVFIRSGVGNIQQELDIDNQEQTTFQPNVGIGLKIKNLYLDYALSDVGDNSAALYSNVFSIKLVFDRIEK